MKINIIDASNYFRGLLLLIRKDHQVTQPEIDLMQKIGTSLGFEKEFCENAIREILENTYIEDVPPKFSTKELALKFVKDGLRLAFVDHEQIHPDEEKWLISIAEQNEIEMKLFLQEFRNAQNHRAEQAKLEVFDLVVEHF
ncbi:MAG: TerB family tellurite resistance protein [Bacteroidetes bacterium]|nr:TerB family tellurite resistance protein [Bacteroidota bacterium]